MELKVYRQSSKERPDGTIVYKGEDALPFVDDEAFWVADGLGGAAAIRHQQIKSEMFDKDKLMDTLFEGVYDKYDDERFVKYVTDSFFELFAVKDCYTENINNIKKSGYFASRIVTAIILHDIIYNDDINPSNLFKKYNSLVSSEEKKEFLKGLEDYFAKKIRDDIREIAKNANLIYESSYAGLALLGSTLCASLYNETEETVEVIYLFAGDSRPYYWTENEGLCQIIRDQEGPDGGMTNYIKANEDETFSIDCRYMKYNKPCVLFNASDGCFDSGYFYSPMSFEKLILEKAVEAETITDMEKSLYEFFLMYGKHDDSSTIAMKLFGYATFDSFKNSAGRRLKTIEEKYISEFPELLEKDYISEYEEYLAKSPGSFSELKPKFEEEKAVRDYCVEQIKSGKYPLYDEKIDKIDEEIENLRCRLSEPQGIIESIVARNYVRFLPIQKKSGSWGEKIAVSKIKSIEEKRNNQAEDFVSLIEGYKSEFEETSDRLKKIIEQIFEVGVPTDFSDYDDVSIAIVEECEQSMDSLFEFFYSVKNKKQAAIKKLAQLRREYVARNLKLAAGNEDNIKRIANMIISKNMDLFEVKSNILHDDYRSLKAELAKIEDYKSRIEKLDKEDRKTVFKECRVAFWEENYMSVINEIVNDKSLEIPKELREEAKTIIDEMNSQSGELKEKAEKQTELFEKYDVSYGRYMGGKVE